MAFYTKICDQIQIKLMIHGGLMAILLSWNYYFYHQFTKQLKNTWSKNYGVGICSTNFFKTIKYQLGSRPWNWKFWENSEKRLFYFSNFFMVAYLLSPNRYNWEIAKVKNYNLYVTEVLDSTLKKSFPGIFNFTVGILTVVALRKPLKLN